MPDPSNLNLELLYLREELESLAQLQFRVRLVHGANVPGTVECTRPEHVRALCAERVSIGCGLNEVIEVKANDP